MCYMCLYYLCRATFHNLEKRRDIDCVGALKIVMLVRTGEGYDAGTSINRLQSQRLHVYAHCDLPLNER